MNLKNEKTFKLPLQGDWVDALLGRLYRVIKCLWFSENKKIISAISRLRGVLFLSIQKFPMYCPCLLMINVLFLYRNLVFPHSFIYSSYNLNTFKQNFSFLFIRRFVPPRQAGLVFTDKLSELVDNDRLDMMMMIMMMMIMMIMMMIIW